MIESFLTLDVGCGNSKRGDVGVDYSRNSQADVISDAHHLPFRDAVFDKVRSHSCLEHSPLPLEFLREQYRVLKKGGQVLCETDNAAYYRWSVQRFGATTDHGNICDDHHCIFVVNHVLRLMEKARFQIKSWHYRRHNPTIYDAMAMFFIKIGFWRENALYSRIIVYATKS